ncbi:MAG: endolytic transglycosylase MltG [Actinomycetota bacterium]|jgi:UPF0755 protein
MSVLTPYDLDHDYDREGSRWPWVLLGGLVAVLLVLLAAFLWVRNQVNPPGGPGDEVVVRVEPGMSVNEIGEMLADIGVISNSTVWRFYVRLNGPDAVEAGEYTLRRNESMGRVLDVLGGGAASTETPDVLTIPEGLTLPQIADIVGELPGRSRDRFLEVASSGQVRSQYQPPGSTNLEGLMLPETYFLARDEDETAIARRLVESFDRLASSLDVSSAAARFNMTPYELIVLASLVEREARVPEDRGPIARVIHNRLAVPMRLQIDATVLYALGEHKDVVLFADLEVQHPYNTYQIDGLPPGPIASPGRASLEAAVSPDVGRWLYYVKYEENGKHAFAVTLDEHNRLVADARSRGVF